MVIPYMVMQLYHYVGHLVSQNQTLWGLKVMESVIKKKVKITETICSKTTFLPPFTYQIFAVQSITPNLPAQTADSDMQFILVNHSYSVNILLSISHAKML